MAEHRLSGTFRKDRHAAWATAAPAPASAVEKPAGLSTGAAAVWDALAPCLARPLTPADVAAFATLCELQATFAEVCRRKDAPAVPAAVLRLERATAAALRPYYDTFGLTPLGRSRWPPLPVVAPPNPLDRFLHPRRPPSPWDGLLK